MTEPEGAPHYAHLAGDVEPERFAPSQNPRPDYKLGDYYRAPFLRAVARIRASAIAQCMPSHPLHGGYEAETARTRDRLTRLREQESRTAATRQARLAQAA